jgi:hypothetical protein
VQKWAETLSVSVIIDTSGLLLKIKFPLFNIEGIETIANDFKKQTLSRKYLLMNTLVQVTGDSSPRSE